MSGLYYSNINKKNKIKKLQLQIDELELDNERNSCIIEKQEDIINTTNKLLKYHTVVNTLIIVYSIFTLILK